MKLINLIKKYWRRRSERKSFEYFLRYGTNSELKDNINNLPRPDKPILRILCNSSNLRHQLEKFDDSADYMVVNFFAIDPAYTQIQPKYYVLADNAFFSSHRDLFDKINAETTWPLTLFVSWGDKRQYNDIQTTSYVNILKVNTYPYTGKSKYRDYCYDHNLAMPPIGNVLNMALYVALCLGYKEIELYGAEHSWIHSMYIDEQNRLHRNDSHFYKESSNRNDIILQHPNGQYTKLHEMLYEYFIVFGTYWQLREIAERKGVQVYNCTPGSYIDAFDRKTTE